jgi:hypothetical protein
VPLDAHNRLLCDRSTFTAIGITRTWWLWCSPAVGRNKPLQSRSVKTLPALVCCSFSQYVLLTWLTADWRVLTAADKMLRVYEIPTAVLVSTIDWSVETGLLNVHHKKMRSAIASRYHPSLHARASSFVSNFFFFC